MPENFLRVRARTCVPMYSHYFMTVCCTPKAQEYEEHTHVYLYCWGFVWSFSRCISRHARVSISCAMHHHVALRISEEEEGTHVSLQVHDRQLYDLKSKMHKLYTIKRAQHPGIIS